MNSTSCCPNTDYCIVDDDGATGCCALGSTCGGPCDDDHYLANITATTTTTGGQTTVQTLLGCAGRACTSTNYQCPSSAGGGCCPYGAECVGNACISTAGSSTSSAASGVFQCGTSGQVCTSGEACTSTGSGYYCAILALSTASGVTSILPSSSPPGGSASSSTASGNHKEVAIGLGVGIPVGLILISALIFLVVRIRRQKLGEEGRGLSEEAREYRKAELPDNQKGVVLELQAHPAEMPAGEQTLVAELHGEEIPAELPQQSVAREEEISTR